MFMAFAWLSIVVIGGFSVAGLRLTRSLESQASELAGPPAASPEPRADRRRT